MTPRPRSLVGLAASLLFPAGALVAAVACSSTPATTGACTPDLPSIQRTIFDRSCATTGCHDATGRSAGLSLTAADSPSQLIGVKAGTCEATRVTPGSPERSLLFQKLSDGACGSRMPFGAAELSAAEKECIRRWIAELPAPVDGGGGPAEGGPAPGCGDTRSSTVNCGTCGNKCPPGAACAEGVCKCPAPLTACGATCVDTTTSAAHCGKCGQACAQGATCVAGECQCPAGSSGTPMAVCGKRCVDPTSDGAHCGKCDQPCTGDTPVCIGGACAADCGALTKCGASCVDTASSFAHCGKCDQACPAGATCAGGECQCPAGTTSCGGACIPTSADPNNCGACGRVCGGGSTCVNGDCACPGGGMVCGGACVLTASDPAHCGGCDRACAPGQTCTNGACTCGSASVSFAGAVQPIFTTSCTPNGCHGNVAPKEGLNLTAGRSHGTLVNVAARQCADGRMRVAPGDPANSYLVHKLTDTAICSGTPMPKTGANLSSADLTTITNWICGGAQNN